MVLLLCSPSVWHRYWKLMTCCRVHGVEQSHDRATAHTSCSFPLEDKQQQYTCTFAQSWWECSYPWNQIISSTDQELTSAGSKQAASVLLCFITNYLHEYNTLLFSDITHTNKLLIKLSGRQISVSHTHSHLRTYLKYFDPDCYDMSSYKCL